MEPIVIAIAVVAAAGVVAAVVASVVLLVRRRGMDTVATPIPEQVGEPQLYIALDAPTIFGLYRQTRGAGVQLTTRFTRSSGFRFGTEAARMKAEMDRVADSQTEAQYLPVEYATRAVSIVERHLQVTGRVPSFDLKAPTDDGPLTDLLKDLHAGADRIGLTVPAEVEKELRRAWKQESRLVKPATLESLGPFVRVRAEFTVTTNRAQGEHVLDFAREDQAGPVRVRIACPRTHVQPSFPPGPCTITATCLGTPTWNEQKRLLELRPISVYLS